VSSQRVPYFCGQGTERVGKEMKGEEGKEILKEGSGKVGKRRTRR